MSVANVIVDTRECNCKVPGLLGDATGIVPEQRELTVGDYQISDEICFERKKQLEDCGDSVECFEMGDCDAGMCLDFEEKDLKEELEKLMNSSSWSLEENALILREANILRLKRRIELEEEAMV